MDHDDLYIADQESTWVRDMREYYQQTGAVRPEDLGRVLGDPAEVVYMEEREDAACCTHWLFGECS